MPSCWPSPYRNSRNRLIESLGFFLFASFAWSLFTFLLNFNPSASSSSLKLWNNLVIVCIIWSIISYYHFVRVYTKPAGIFTYSGYACVLIVLALSFAGYVVREASFVNGRFQHDIGPWVFILMAILLPTIAIAMVMLIKQYRVSKDPIERNKIST